jgi:hypothetical protein
VLTARIAAQPGTPIALAELDGMVLIADCRWFWGRDSTKSNVRSR